MRISTLLLSFFMVVAITNAEAQCPTCVVDFGALTEPGLSPDPDSIPCIEQGVGYSQTVQFFNFDTISFSGQLLTIDSLEIDSVGGMPTGINWSTNKSNNRFGNQEKGCIQLCDSTNDPVGNYPLVILAKVWASNFATGTPFPVYPLTVDAASVSDNLSVVLRVITQGGNCDFGTGIADLLEEGSLKLIPNPAQNNAVVRFNAIEAADYTLNVIDLVGKTVISKQITAVPGQNDININVSELSNGVYMYSLNNGIQAVTNSFVVAH